MEKFYLNENQLFIDSDVGYELCIKKPNNWMLVGILCIHGESLVFHSCCGSGRKFKSFDEFPVIGQTPDFFVLNGYINDIDEISYFLSYRYEVELTEEFKDHILAQMVMKKLTE